MGEEITGGGEGEERRGGRRRDCNTSLSLTSQTNCVLITTESELMNTSRQMDAHRLLNFSGFSSLPRWKSRAMAAVQSQGSYS